MKALTLITTLVLSLHLLAAEKPNVLFIIADDLNDFPTYMGRYPDAKTPNLDTLAARGMAFQNAHCQYPLCGPSRASFMTGMHPLTLGYTTHMTDEALQKKAGQMGTSLLHSYFSKHGYKTMAVGKICHKHVPKGSVDLSGGRGDFSAGLGRLGKHWNVKGTSTDWAAAPEKDVQMPDYEAAQWAIERLQEKHEKPFMLMVGFLRPHVPWYVPQKWYDLYPDVNTLTKPPYRKDDLNDVPEISKKLNIDPRMPTTEELKLRGQWGDLLQSYLACASFTDHYIGEVLKALEDSPYKENTIIVLISDHGYHMGEKNTFQKHSLWERSSHVPMVIAGPGVKPGQSSKAPVGLIDLYPTLLDLCGLPANAKNEGNSLLPLIQDPDLKWEHPVLTSWQGNNIAVQDEQYRYIRYDSGEEELYDHSKDLNEWNNLATDPRLDGVKKRLAAEMLQPKAKPER
ncbi:Arylsulfatase A [Rubritalea squalenifaciens DSM 18772]|uniref:Arylsulfatase A n=1 Tax=Rubritalea squalenifaciens DSM 18772 TaxID=1123071 RepID=A0A1M6KTG4_9BACT|nr:sulfatase [Rubritalea squalenifaciens]SHJ62247.1 Arylsulfatase A [Rubritalea squalenifaciens DSM 18772]